MKKGLLLYSASAAICVLLMSIPALAHHGGAEWDTKKTVTLQATIVDLLYVNPHALIDFTVKNDKGEVEQWTAELQSPTLLNRRGWTRSSLKPGDQVTIVGSPAKNGSKGLALKKIIFPDGHELGGQSLPPDSPN